MSPRRCLAVPLALLLSRCGGPVSAPILDAGARDTGAALDAQGPFGAGTCAQATPVVDGTQREGETLDGAQAGGGCLGAVRSVSYRVTVPAGETLTARVPWADGPVVLQVVAACEDTACLAQSSTSGETPLRAVWANTGTTAREVRVLAGSFTTWSGRFAISFALTRTATNLRCADAESLTDGDWRGEQPFGPGATVEPVCANRTAPAAGGVRWYRVDVPPGSVAVATLTPGPELPGRTFGVAAVFRSDCETSDCVASTPTLLRARSTLVAENSSDAPRTVRLGVGVYPAQADGTFSLAMRVLPRDPAARCDGAEALTEGVEARGDTALSAAVVPLCDGLSDGGPVRFHRVTVPAGRFLELQATTAANVPLAVRAIASCDALTCVADAPPAPSTTLRVPNLTDAPRALLVAVGARTPNARVAYGLTARFVAPEAAGRCEAAEVFAARSVTLDTQRVAENGAACEGGGVVGPARWVRLTVPPNTAMRLSASGNIENGRPVSIAIRVRAACDAPACLTHGFSQATWTNTTDAPQELLVAAGAALPDHRGVITLYAVPQVIAANSTCARRTAVTPSSPALREQGVQSFAMAPWCDGAPRNVRWYSATVPAGEVLHAWARNPFSAFSSGMPSLALRETCEGACLAEGTSPLSRGSHLWWRNEGDAPRTVVVQAGWSSLSGSTYDLAVETFAPEGNRCADADALTSPASVPLLRGEAQGTACSPAPRGPVRWFRSAVPAGRSIRWRATATTTSPPQPLVVEVQQGCINACLGRAQGSTVAEVSWRNEGDVEADVRVAVRSLDGAALSGVNVTATLE